MLRAACGSGAAKTVETVAHALKGSSGNLGISAMRRLAERLQVMGRAGSLEGAAALVDDLETELGLAGEYLGGLLLEQENSS